MQGTQRQLLAQFFQPSSASREPSSAGGSSALMQAKELNGLLGGGGANDVQQRSDGVSAAAQAVELRSLIAPDGHRAVQRSGGGAMGEKAQAGFDGQAGVLPYRSQLESMFGVDLSGIRAYTGSKAEAAASSLGATAYAHQGDVVLGKGGTDFRTVAEETSHALQMRRGAVGSSAGKVSRAAPQEREARHRANEAVAGHHVGALATSLDPMSVALSEGSGPTPAVADKKLKPFWDSGWRTLLEAGLAALVSTAVGVALGAGAVATLGIGAAVGAVVGATFKYFELRSDTTPDKWAAVGKAALAGSFAGALGGAAGLAVGAVVHGAHGAAYYAAKWAGKTITEFFTEKVLHHLSHGGSHGHANQAAAVAAFQKALTDGATPAATSTVARAESEIDKRAAEAQEMVEKYGAAYGYDPIAAGGGGGGAVPRFGG